MNQITCKTNDFLKILKSLNSVNADVPIVFDKNGMHVQALDNSHISTVVVDIPPSYFDIYDVSEELQMGLHLPPFIKMFNTHKNTNVDMSIKDNKIRAEFKSSDGGLSSSYTVRVMDVQLVNMSIPEMEFHHVVTLNAGEFAKDISIMQRLGFDTVRIETHNDSSGPFMRFVASNTDDMIEENITNLRNVSIESLDDVDQFAAEFSVGFLEKFSKSCTHVQDVEIKMLAGMPLCLVYGLVTFYIASKMDE